MWEVIKTWHINVMSKEGMPTIPIQIERENCSMGLKLRHNGQTFTDDIFKFVILKENYCILVHSSFEMSLNGPLATYANLRFAHAPGMPGTFPRHQLKRKLLVSDPGMHHGTCVTHVPRCMSRSLTCGGGENVPDIPGSCANLNLMYLARGPWIIILGSK